MGRGRTAGEVGGRGGDGARRAAAPCPATGLPPASQPANLVAHRPSGRRCWPRRRRARPCALGWWSCEGGDAGRRTARGSCVRTTPPLASYLTRPRARIRHPCATHLIWPRRCPAGPPGRVGQPGGARRRGARRGGNAHTSRRPPLGLPARPAELSSLAYAALTASYAPALPRPHAPRGSTARRRAAARCAGAGRPERRPSIAPPRSTAEPRASSAPRGLLSRRRVDGTLADRRHFRAALAATSARTRAAAAAAGVLVAVAAGARRHAAPLASWSSAWAPARCRRGCRRRAAELASRTHQVADQHPRLVVRAVRRRSGGAPARGVDEPRRNSTSAIAGAARRARNGLAPVALS